MQFETVKLKVKLSFEVLLHQIFAIRLLLFVTCYLCFAIWIFLSETCYNLQKLVPFARCCTSRNFFIMTPPLRRVAKSNQAILSLPPQPMLTLVVGGIYLSPSLPVQKQIIWSPPFYYHSASFSKVGERFLATLSLSRFVRLSVCYLVMKEILKLKQDLLGVLSSPEEFQLCFKNV